MKNLSIVFLAILIVSIAVVSCRKKEGEEPIAVESVSLLPAKTSVVLNGTHELKATVSPPNATDKSLTWDSDNQDAVTVDQNGVVTGKVPGTAIITAVSKSNPDKSAKCEVQVVKEKVTFITITPEKPVVAKGTTLELKVTVLPAEAAQSVTWSSGDETKATVDPAGVVTGVETGETTIIATATDGSGVKGEVKITVQSELPAAEATITGITLGAEEIFVSVPKPGASIALSNAPHTIVSDPEGVQVNITATEGAVIKIGDAPFTSGQKVPFKPSVTFSVTEEGKTGSNEYTLTILPYNKESNPYGIYTVAHLHDVRNALNEGFKLMDDLTLPAASAGLPEISDYGERGWLPIGDGKNPFTGSLDGAGHTIGDLSITRNTLVHVGLFGKVGTGATIKKLGVSTLNSENQGVNGEYRTDRQYCGILAGQNEGTIEDCYTTGKAISSAVTTGHAHAGGLVGAHEGGQIRRCYSTATVSGTASGGADNSFIGGLVGYNSANLNECYATGKVYAFASGTNSTSYAGGLIGNCDKGQVSKCYATGEIRSESTAKAAQLGAFAGGLMGRISATTVSDCYALGNVVAKTTTDENGNYTFTGGFAGRINANAPVSNCYAVGDVSTDKAANQLTGSFGGYIEDGNTKITNCYRKDGNVTRRGSSREPEDKDQIPSKSLGDMKTSAFKDLLNGSNTVWGQGGKNNDLPYLLGVGDVGVVE